MNRRTHPADSTETARKRVRSFALKIMTPIVYVLSGSKPRQPERSTLAALDALRDQFDPIVFAAGDYDCDSLAEFGLPLRRFDGPTGLLRQFRALLADSPELTFVASEPRPAYLMMLLNVLYRRRVNHIHIVPAEDDEGALVRSSALRKYDVRYVAETESTRVGLIARGVGRDRVRVFDRFIADDGRSTATRRGPFKMSGVRRVAVVGRTSEIDDFVRAGIVDEAPDGIEFVIFTSTERSGDVTGASKAVFADDSGLWNCHGTWDLLLSLTPWECSEGHVLEALAAGVPVLIAAEDAFSTIVSDGINGFVYRDGDFAHLATRLQMLTRISHDRLNSVAKGGEYLLKIRFSAEKGIERYRQLFEQRHLPPVELNGGKLIL